MEEDHPDHVSKRTKLSETHQEVQTKMHESTGIIGPAVVDNMASSVVMSDEQQSQSSLEPKIMPGAYTQREEVCTLVMTYDMIST